MSIRSLLLVGAIVLLGTTAPSLSAAEGPERFLGSFVGQTLSAASDEVSPRDITVKIEPGERDNEFFLEWTLVSVKSSGKIKRKQYRIKFAETRRDGIYKSKMRADMFGNQVPLDPLKGEPFVWAKIEGSTLTVHTLLITDEGGYEMQTYNRTVTAEGMELKFTRVRDDQVMRTVTGKLKKVQ